MRTNQTAIDEAVTATVAFLAEHDDERAVELNKVSADRLLDAIEARGGLVGGMVRADIYHAVASEVMERALGVAGRATKAAVVEVDRSAAAVVEVELLAIRKDILARIAKVGKKLKRKKGDCQESCV